jgi:hypothetical protein
MDEPTALGACIGVLVLYNALALACHRASGLSLMVLSGRLWSRKHISGRSATDVTLAIQTLRNTVLVAIFVGTLSFTVASAALATASAPTTDSSPGRARALLQATLLTGSFLNFALVIRCAAHAGYLIGAITQPLPGPPSPGSATAMAPPTEVAAATATTALPALSLRAAEEGGGGADDPSSHLDHHDEIITLLQMQAVHFSLGFRFFYCSIPFGFAVVGPQVLVAATCVILAFLLYIDNSLALWDWFSGVKGRKDRGARAV